MLALADDEKKLIIEKRGKILVICEVPTSSLKD